MERLALVQHYADRESVEYDVAYELLLEEAASHDSALEFLEEVGFERDYVYDAQQLMQLAQRH